MKTQGIVTRSTGLWYSVLCEDSKHIECRLKGKLRLRGLKSTNPVAVGDHVIVELLENEDYVLSEVLPRNNYMIRKATKLSKISHIIASNIDRAFLIITLSSPRTSSGFIDRFLVTAEAYHIPVSLIFNKIDLITAKEKTLLNQWMSLYRNIGYGCHETSATEHIGIEAIREALMGKTSLFSGHSGVGKSALINAIEPTLILKTGNISSYHQKGTHTTTFAEMVPLSFGGYIIDTPGIKEFGMIDLKQEELSHYFPEMAALVNACGFHNCTHTHEPRCAVKQAVENGKINLLRYQNYCSMLNDEGFNIAEWENK
jgi:ribosome biogenesis GTPase